MAPTGGRRVRPDRPRQPADDETRQWLENLDERSPRRDEALLELHQFLVRAAYAELRRRQGRHPLNGPEVDDLAQQAADDATVAIIAKLKTFRGDSRFTTWAYKFVILEVSTKLGRHFWQRPTIPLDGDKWDLLPDRFGVSPDDHAAQAELVGAVRQAVSEELTEHQRHIFVSLVVDAIPLDALVCQLGSNRNAIYKTMFDARRKLRSALVAKGQIDARTPTEPSPKHSKGTFVTGWDQLDHFVQTDPRDVGCDQALHLLHVYVDLVVDVGGAEAARRYPGIAAHLRACGPCTDDFDGLLSAVENNRVPGSPDERRAGPPPPTKRGKTGPTR